jgi:hypothetical protein
VAIVCARKALTSRRDLPSSVDLLRLQLVDLLLESSILFLKLVVSQKQLLKLRVQQLQGGLILVDDRDIGR